MSPLQGYEVRLPRILIHIGLCPMLVYTAPLGLECFVYNHTISAAAQSHNHSQNIKKAIKLKFITKKSIKNYRNNFPFSVSKNTSNGISSCLINPLDGKSPLSTISMTAAIEAAVVQEIALHSCPSMVIGENAL